MEMNRIWNIIILDYKLSDWLFLRFLLQMFWNLVYFMNKLVILYIVLYFNTDSVGLGP